MKKRNIITIDEKKCDGCGLCMPNCPEGAIQIIAGKARLISDLFCDGLGACIGHCPKGAITIEEREAQAYEEEKVMENIIKQGPDVIKAHLEHLRSHKQEKFLKEALNFLKDRHIKIDALDSKKEIPCACPGSKEAVFTKSDKTKSSSNVSIDSELGNWPVQLRLVSPLASYFNDADILIAADCVAFAYANFHQKLLKNKVLLVGCPKLDDIALYQEKITQILVNNNVKSITYAHMEVPCCFGLINVIKQAISDSSKLIDFKEIVISIKGEIIK